MKLWGMCALVATDVGHKRNVRAQAQAADALLTLGYRWFSAGGYFASKASNVFKDVFLARNMDMQTHDCATYIKLETKSGDPYTHLLTGLNAGVEARVYMPVHWKARAAAPPGAPDKILDFYSPAHESPVSHHRARIFGGVFLTNNMLQHDCAVRRGA
nr:major outer sheath C-terminal domain-containing protein [Treponema paraluiscuniculi]